MKFLILAVVAVVAVVQGVPTAYGPGYIGGYGQGSQYGNSGHQGHRHGYQNAGHANNVASTGHNIGHVEDDFDSNVHHHQAADHNIGHSINAGNAGHQNNGYGAYDQAHNGFGNNWQHGYGI